MLDFLIISLICSYGLAVVLVEKGNDWPVKPVVIRLRLILRKKLGRKAQKLLICTICTSFWAALLVDIILFFLSGFSYFLWPLSGFAAAGLTWTIYETLSTIESSKEVGM